jgi:hypothetical protein
MASIGTWPTSILARSCRMVLDTNQIVNESPQGGSEQVVDRLNDRWACSLTLPARNHEDAAELEAFLASFRGQVNWVSLWHFGRPEPRGTLRGTPFISGAHAIGSSTLHINCDTGDTLLAGDLIGAGGMLLMVAEDCAEAGGFIDVPLVNRTRLALASLAAVTWDKPTAPFRLLSHSGVNYFGGRTDEVTMELRERVA